jgi:DNA-binding transcriptional regulator GbsR (MarR family)
MALSPLGWHVFGLPGAHDLVAQGKSADEIAAALDVSELTVKRWAQRSRITLPASTPKGKDERHQRVVDLALSGRTLDEIAAATEYSYPAVSSILRKYGVKAVSKWAARGPQDLERAEKMASMYRQGIVLEKIGEHFGITRERARQVLRKIGVTAQEGGACKLAEHNKAAIIAKRNLRTMTKWGLKYGEMKARRKDGTLTAFIQQRNSSGSRGIVWRLSFAEWLDVWLQSGKMALRGRGKDNYCMSRIKDEGGYVLGNVHIQRNSDNNSQGLAKCRNNKAAHAGVWRLYPGLAKPWVAKYSKTLIGFYATEDEASAARQDYVERHSLTPRIHGRGYAIIRGKNGNDRYQVMVGRQYVGTFKTPEAALQARATALQQLTQAA